MNRAFNRLVNVVTRVSLSDTQCGYKAFRAPAAKLLFHCSITERFAFDVEILTLARRLGLTIAEVPVQWSRVRGSRVRPWLDPGTMTRDVIRASRRAKSAPPVPALTVDPGRGRAGDPDTSVALKALVQELAPFLPVVRQDDGSLLVLCPLMTEAQIAGTADANHLLLPPGSPATLAPDHRPAQCSCPAVLERGFVNRTSSSSEMRRVPGSIPWPGDHRTRRHHRDTGIQGDRPDPDPARVAGVRGGPAPV